MLSEYKGFHCQHRSDDFPTIEAILLAHRPLVIVELGTDQGGFAGFLADMALGWGGKVTTFDLERKFDPRLTDTFSNLRAVEADVLTEAHPRVAALVSKPRVLLYCDNGNKKREMELYAPMLQGGSLLGVHDYGSEVDAEWAESFMEEHGYSKEGHSRMEALRNEWYEPMTRFWVRRSFEP